MLTLYLLIFLLLIIYQTGFQGTKPTSNQTVIPEKKINNESSNFIEAKKFTRLEINGLQTTVLGVNTNINTGQLILIRPYFRKILS
ncbi:unnamed protein product [Schistosoma rodhaini]|uniref:Uncharacterized protein n=1 Tax=Schistosoma rodhaini TaxID=6188 RepID=A0AA85G7R6_9TREM|nr:unnamed protein product [Schistosoma rodhaini]